MFVVAVMILVFGSWAFYPLLLILLNSFNVSAVRQTPVYSLENWRIAFAEPDLWVALGNTFMVYGAFTVISFPLAVLIAWTLARTNVHFTYALEFMFWVSFMMPSIAVLIGWTMLLDSHIGMLNKGLEFLPFVDKGPFNIYSVPGIIWIHLMGNALATKVMLLTPAFRNMNVALEEAAQVSGASKLITMIRITLPVMVPAMVVVFMLNLVRVFQSFEVELILGTPIKFFVYSTKIFQFLRFYDPPEYGQAAALGSVTLIIIAVIIPLQRWLLGRRHYTTVTGQFKPGLIDLGKSRPFVFAGIAGIITLLTVLPLVILLAGSLMTRVGFFNAIPLFTFDHWTAVVSDSFFLKALRTTLLLSLTTAVISPILFSLVSYVLVRTRWSGRWALDSVFWISSAIPGILSGLGLLWLFLGTPILVPLFGTIWALLIVVILQGQLFSTQVSKGIFLQMGADLEEAARIAGAGWTYTYLHIWLPLLAPTLVLIGVFNFVIAANTTSSIILLASRDTVTLSILALEMMTNASGSQVEAAGIVSLFIVTLTVIVALIARRFGLALGVRHDISAGASRRRTEAPAAIVPAADRKPG